jgi:Domain of unknown function (DUF5615)
MCGRSRCGSTTLDWSKTRPPSSLRMELYPAPQDRASSQRDRRRRSAVKILVDEMYPATVAQALRSAGIEAATVTDLRLAGASDPVVFAAAAAGGYCALTENVGDFTRIAAEHNLAGGHHHGLLIALSSRFSRRPAGIGPLIAAIQATSDEQIADRVVYLAKAGPPSSYT